MAGEKLEALDRRIAEMQAMREELVTMITEWDERLAATRDGQPAHLLEQPGAVRRGEKPGSCAPRPAHRALKRRKDER
jgi:hypothetical protein